MMNNEENNKLRDAYRKLNESFKPVLIFHIGESAGFFSEYNCMIFSMLYCLQRRIQFKLYSTDANFGYNRGWTDFFEPFCKEEDSRWHHWINMRPTGQWLSILKTKDFNLFKWKLKKNFFNLIAKGWKLFHPKTYLTQDIWPCLFTKEVGSQYYSIPEIGIDGDIQVACSRLIEISWGYNKNTAFEVRQKINKLRLPKQYVSWHVRRGDKIIEVKHFTQLEYYKKVQHAKSDNLFIATDDYSIIEESRALLPLSNIYTLSSQKNRGYDQKEVAAWLFEEKKEHYLDLFTTVEILNDSIEFIGGSTSNVAFFQRMRNPSKTTDIDLDTQCFFSLCYPDSCSFEKLL